MLVIILTLTVSIFITTWLAGKFLTLLLNAILKGEQDHYLNEFAQKGQSRISEIIGWLERFLVLLFVLIGYYQGVGFVLAAKSVLRYGEIKSDQDRMFAEYVIVGTLMSFAIALLLGIITRLLLGFPLK